ncbi:MAG: hypothetical protein HY288_12740 [Planctomycetia bacterium]|nr:hypothetical protein [Planctomycetia bacterium]
MGIFVIWILLSAAPGEAATGGELASQVSRLLRQLNAPELTQRDQAERTLFEMGAAVLPLLPIVGESTPQEVSLRVTRVQQKLLRAQANSAAEPSLVTLKGTDLSLAEALQSIAKQTHNPIIDHREAFGEKAGDARVNADFEKTPFWRALDRLLDQADLTLYGYAGQRGAFVVNRPAGETARSERAVYAGLFRLEPTRFEAVRDLRNTNAQSQSLNFFLEVTWEPRLQPIAILQPLGEIRATGNTGEAIAAASAKAEPEASIREGTSAVELEIPLSLPRRTTEKISTLKGKLLALVPGEAEDFRFRNLPVAAKNIAPKSVEQRKAGVTVTIDQVRKNNLAWEVSLRVRFDEPSSALESHRNWILENPVYFVGSDGQHIEPGGFEQTRQSKDEVGLNYFFDMKDSPEKLEFVYRTPITILEMTVDYEFRDLRLP